MTPEEYEELRSNAIHSRSLPPRCMSFPDVERIVEKRERYWVVEKIGEAAEVAEQLDIREVAACGFGSSHGSPGCRLRKAQVFGPAPVYTG